MHMNSGGGMGIGASGAGNGGGSGVLVGGGAVNLVNNFGHNGDSRPPPPPHSSLLHMAGNKMLYFCL